MSKILTAGELMAMLRQVDPNTQVWEERNGEHRRLRVDDVTIGDECQLTDAERNREVQCDNYVIIGAVWI